MVQSAGDIINHCNFTRSRIAAKQRFMAMNNERRSVLCPNCRRLISIDEDICPYCGLVKPGAQYRRFLSFPAPPVDPVKGLIAVNVVFYIASLFLQPAGMGLAIDPLRFLSPSEGSLFLLGATGTLPIGHFGRWWTLISASFLHGGLLHLFFNMMALSQLGPFVVEAYGFYRFSAIYILSGVGGFLLSTLAGVPFTIGASASICGLIGAIMYFGKSRGGFYGAIIYRQAMGWVVGLVLFGLIVPGINNWAHGGGVLAGIATGFSLGYNERSAEMAAHRTVGALCLLLTAAVLIWVLLQALYAVFHLGK